MIIAGQVKYEERNGLFWAARHSLSLGGVNVPCSPSATHPQNPFPDRQNSIKPLPFALFPPKTVSNLPPRPF